MHVTFVIIWCSVRRIIMKALVLAFVLSLALLPVTTGKPVHPEETDPRVVLPEIEELLMALGSFPPTCL